MTRCLWCDQIVGSLRDYSCRVGGESWHQDEEESAESAPNSAPPPLATCGFSARIAGSFDSCQAYSSLISIECPSMQRHEYEEDADRFLPARDRAEHYNALPKEVIVLILVVVAVTAVVAIVGAILLFARA